MRDLDGPQGRFFPQYGHTNPDHAHAIRTELAPGVEEEERLPPRPPSAVPQHLDLDASKVAELIEPLVDASWQTYASVVDVVSGGSGFRLGYFSVFVPRKSIVDDQLVAVAVSKFWKLIFNSLVRVFCLVFVFDVFSL